MAAKYVRKDLGSYVIACQTISRSRASLKILCSGSLFGVLRRFNPENIPTAITTATPGHQVADVRAPQEGNLQTDGDASTLALWGTGDGEPNHTVSSSIGTLMSCATPVWPANMGYIIPPTPQGKTIPPICKTIPPLSIIDFTFAQKILISGRRDCQDLFRCGGFCFLGGILFPWWLVSESF